MKYTKQTKFESLKDLREYERLQDSHVDGMDKRNPHESWKKDMFRKSKEWRWFCKTLIEKRGGVCERCGGKGEDCSGLQVHHIHPEDYTNLKEENFVVICGRCHLLIERFSRTEESRKMCPKSDRRFLTAEPYVDSQRDVLSYQSGLRTAEKWAKSISAQKSPEKWLIPPPKVDRKQAKKAVDFMKEHPELFR
jgi:hypothetical protein